MTCFDEARVLQGGADAWDAFYESCEPPAGDPVDADESYVLGWWSGIAECTAWHAGWEAALRGVRACPYTAADDESSREFWLKGYADALALDTEGTGHA